MRIMVVGQRESGKTTLLETWTGQWTSPETGIPTTRPLKYETIKVDIGRTNFLGFNWRLTLRRCIDISGGQETMREFSADMSRARAVLYLLDARHLVSEEERQREERETGRPSAQSKEWERIISDASRIKRFSTRVHRILIVVTHTDMDPRAKRLTKAEYTDLIKEQLYQMTRDMEAAYIDTIAGSMDTLENAKSLSLEIAEWLA